MPRLENWSVVSNANPYTAPEAVKHYLVGEVYGHSNPLRHPDGKEIRTSRIKAISKDGLIITKSGSAYRLGQVDPEYEKQYPDAENRIKKVIDSRKN